MKRSTLPLTLTLTAASGLWMNTLFAQQPAPAAAPAPPPAADGKPAAAAPAGNFKDDKERRSYGLGSFLASREKSAAASQPERGPVNIDEVLAGLADGLTATKSQNYAAGLAIATQIKRSGVDVDPEVLKEALRAGLGDQPGRMTPAEVQTVMTQLNAELQQQQQAKQKAEAGKNLAAANAFLEKNKTAEGVTVTPSGLQYKIEKTGEGAKPALQDLVTMNVLGTLPEGQEFERNPQGTPSKRPLASLVKGLQEGLQLLKVGGKAKFWIPPVLGYGETPRGAVLKPNSVLVFEVELTATEPAPPPAPRPAGGPLQGRPATAVTPPVSVDIPQQPKPAPATTPPVQVPPAPPAAPVPPAPPAK